MRTGYNTKPYEKHMELFQNFSGGLNTVSPPDGMLDTELTDMMNQDIEERGSLKRRHGLRKVKSVPAGAMQGYFRYYKPDGSYDELFAIAGDLYLNGGTTPVHINGMNDIGGFKAFQTTRPVEAVQFGSILYIATGTKLAQYDGTNFDLVKFYTPNTMEMTYIGSNALAYDPESHLKDSTGSVASIDYALPKQTDGYPFGIFMNVYCTKLVGETYEFAVQIRNATQKDQAWEAIPSTAWETLTGNSTKTKRVYMPGGIEIRVSMRKTGTTTVLSEFVAPYTVLGVEEQKKKQAVGWGSIHTCNRIFTHWGRMMLYGDPSMPATVYISHLNTPNYFPALLNIEFDSPKREPLTQVVHYRNSLVLFTKSSTQALYGTGPDDYRRVMLHTDLGCVAPYGAAVMKNHIGFLSLQGIYALKTIGLTDDKATVEKLDTKIANLVPIHTNVLTVFVDGQLQVTFPNLRTRFRFYSDLGAWTKDYSDKFSFEGIRNIDGEIYTYRNGSLYVFDKNVYNDDDYNYSNYFETKNFSFGQPYHFKKLKELQVLTNPNNQRMESTVIIYADEAAVIGAEDAYASVSEDGNVTWNVSFEPNFVTEEGTVLGEWVLGESPFGETIYALKKLKLTGKCRRTRLRFLNSQPNENHFVGFSYIFKLKKP